VLSFTTEWQIPEKSENLIDGSKVLYSNTSQPQKLHLLFMTSNRRALKQLSNSPNQSANGRCLSGQKPRRKICATSRKMVPTRSSEPGSFGEDRGTRASG
jgi:hypothetical protein